MASTRASISKASKRPKINIIPPKQLFVDLTHDDTKTPSPTLQLSSPSAPNAPSKTPSTKDTSSSSIDYIPKSPTSSTSLSPNGYLNSPTSPPPRVSPPPPTQENASMDTTLTLSPITPLDVQFDTPLPSPPIFGHSIPWNLFEVDCGDHLKRTLEFGAQRVEWGEKGFQLKVLDPLKAIALDSPYLLVLITGTSQSRQHVDTSLIHIESRKSPTKSLIDVGSRRISIFTVNTKEYHSDVLAIITRIMRRT
ncbi:hypothetical protein Tco_0193984 [Tanacetum coccineum]